MIFTSQVLSAASGSVGGVTYSHNKGGMYTRTRAIPTNPNSTRQQKVRSAMAEASQLWGLLSEAQRAAWNLYAANVPMTNKLGQSFHLSGQQHFIRTNAFRIAMLNDTEGGQFWQVEDAPTEFNLGSIGSITADTFSAATQNFNLNYDDTQGWTTVAGSFLVVFMGMPQNASIGFFKGPWRMVRVLEGEDPAPTPPLVTTTTLGWEITPGQKVWIRAVLSQADGRLSNEVVYGPTLVGA